MIASEDLDQYLSPTWFLDCDKPDVAEYARRATAGASDDKARAVKLFYAVRDRVRYDPYSITAEPVEY
ncbi:MAG: hypothetical protein ACYDGY_11195 [Acidimicrobiales bacterium]